jgi:hypothetical protein
LLIGSALRNSGKVRPYAGPFAGRESGFCSYEQKRCQTDLAPRSR